MVDVLNTVVIIASIISSSAGLGYWLASKFFRIEGRLDGLENRLDRLEGAIYSYNELLLKVLESKGILTSTEAIALVHSLKALLPAGSSKYYTKEVEEKLRNLLDKDLNEYTLEDTRELERIADLMAEEYAVTRRRDLLDYQAKLRILAQVIRIVFVEPKIVRGEQVLKPGEKRRSEDKAL